jgi:hypothetical protein
MASFADAIEPQQNLSGALSYQIKAIIEEAGQTFLYGMPVMISSTDGGVLLWDGSVGAGHLLAGVAVQNAQNLGTTGAGAPSGFSPILGPGSSIGSFAANANQSLAVITPPMVPITDGFSYFAVAGPTAVFRAKVGTSATVTPVATTNQMAGSQTAGSSQFGLTKDTGNNFWYVDTNKTGASAMVQIIGLDPLEPVGTVGGHVFFTFLQANVAVPAV